MSIKHGDMVKVNYTGKLEDGSIFDTSKEDLAREAGVYVPYKKYEPM